MVMDPFLVIVAANKAVHSQKQGKMTTKTVHSEILFNLSPSRKITESFRKFGIGDRDESLLVVVVQNDQSEKTCKALQSLRETVIGEEVAVDELPSLADMSEIEKEYKLADIELSTCSALDALVSRIAAKDIISL
ncbi:hypothetical protein C0Q70_08507 [Pomacea canaliculata]|uniref:Uncharacterized protein n=2 Tax=Pomacea canaliculata TaxID=400727 RepID=A0A2T7PI17_POMCA|nr:hypothetical protein C0Q70_08507 [Pomacea canaliculata]